MQSSSFDSNQVKIRWWPLVLAVLAFGLGQYFIWSGESENHQMRFMSSVGLGILLGLFLLIWIAFISRLAGKTRGILLVLAIGLCALSAFSLEIRGFSGNLVPILAWRFSPKLDETMETTSLTAKDQGIKQLEGVVDYPRYLGPKGNAVLEGPKLATNWRDNQPELMWRIEVGLGWSAFSVVGNRAVTMEQRGEHEMTVCYDLETGKTIWSHGSKTRHSEPLGGDGPRSTPTIIDGKVYSLGATGVLKCLNFETGELIWSQNILEDHQAEAPPFGVACSPLIDGDRVVVSPGGRNNGAIAIYDRHSGKLLMGGGSDPAAYATPVPATLAGRQQYLVFNDRNIVGHDYNTAEVLWSYVWPEGTERCSQPIALSDDRVFVSSGYGIGAKMFKIANDGDKQKATLLWESMRLKAKFSVSFVVDDVIYGLDDGIMTCIDLETGDRRWKAGRYGHGQMIKVGDIFLILSERGEVSLVEVNPTEYRELAKMKVLSGKTWNHPTLAGNRLIVRNSKEAACLRLPIE